MENILTLLVKYYLLTGSATNVIHFSTLDSILSPLSAKIGVQYTVLKYAISLLVSCPLGCILRINCGSKLKHLFSAICGVVLLQWVFGPDWIHSFISSTISYIICTSLPKKYVPYVNLIWVMGFLAACHCYQMYFHYMSTIFDYRNTQMILSIKLTSLGWNLYDGTYDLEHINKSHPDPKINKMMTDRKKFLITSMPNLLEFYGYVYCFPCIMVGPAFEYKEYIDIITEKAFTHRKSYNKSTSTSTSTSRTNMTEQHPPSSLYAGLFSFVQGLLFLPLHLLISTNFPIHKVISTDFINSNNIFSRYLYTWIAIYGIRFKFYFAWKIAEAASTLAGFGFEGFDEQGHVKGWRGVQNVDILALETATNMQTIVRQWNKRTQGWLERYVYLRTGNSMVITYIFSALWHGFYPGFLMFFLSISYITFAERGLKRWIKAFIPSNSIASKLINFISKILPNAIFNYTTPLFFFLSFQPSLTYLKSFYFLPDTLMMVAATVFFFMNFDNINIPSKRDKIT